jgi:hypothetical protein
MSVLVKTLPQLVDGCACRFSSNIEQDTNFRFDQLAEGVEKPPMAVQFLLVLFFKAKDDLNRAGVHRGLPGLGTNNAGGVLKDVRGNRLAVDGVFGNAFLVATHEVEDLEGPFVHFASPVRNDTNNDFLPTICAPRFGSVASAEVSDVLEN